MISAKQHPLASYLARENITLTEAGHRFGCADTTISRIINDNRPPSSELMQRIIDKTNGALLPNQFYRLPHSAAE
ncbi:helix-turn-helix domain-containing protein [Cohaesibacter celericrescens]|uniref:helix-turn-helix domain-containing protein n=1 Tax=Cohaesibacter celericrescens TaxID=2067669 RepID=UPI0011AF6D2F